MPVIAAPAITIVSQYATYPWTCRAIWPESSHFPIPQLAFNVVRSTPKRKAKSRRATYNHPKLPIAQEIPVAVSAVRADSDPVQLSQLRKTRLLAATAQSRSKTWKTLKCAKANRRANSLVNTNGVIAAKAQVISATRGCASIADSISAAALSTHVAAADNATLRRSELNACSAAPDKWSIWIVYGRVISDSCAASSSASNETAVA